MIGQQPPVQGPIPVRVTNAFAVGFFAFFGAFVASLLFWIVAFVLLFVFGLAAAIGLHSGH